MDVKSLLVGVLCVCFAGGVLSLSQCIASALLETEDKTEEQLRLEEMEALAAKATAAEVRPVRADTANLIALLPEDTTPRFALREIRLSGNTLIPAETLLSGIPAVYDSSAQKDPVSAMLYDLRPIQSLIEQPGTAVEVSARSIQGLTQYLLSFYQNRSYAGIYIYVPSEAFEPERELAQGILPVRILEAPVTQVSSRYYNVEGQPSEKSYLRPSVLKQWSPVRQGQVANRKQLDNYLNLLNLNPDRYVSASVSKGEEPETLAVNYNVYEANPWHWFVQVDNAGTKDRRYAPRLGLINTNLFGFDDRLTVYYQAKWEKGIEDKYSIFGSYDFPLLGPALRLELFGAYNEFDISGGGGIDFLGRGSMYGGKLRYNAFQHDGWFFDLTTSLSREESTVSSSIFNAILGSQVQMNLWGVGAELYRRTDMANSFIGVERIENIGGGSAQSKYWDGDPINPTGARQNAVRDFSIYTTTASHSQYLDTDKVNRLSGSFRWILPDERLVPARMTTFGGMYTVRGYRESGIVADGGILASVQYEYDLIKAEQAKVRAAEAMAADAKPFLRKLAPLVFFDYGRAKYKNIVSGERNEELYSVGVGGLIELGDHFRGAVYYGFPLESTATTDTSDGRLNLSLMMRW